jgi:hypothetical protein
MPSDMPSYVPSTAPSKKPSCSGKGMGSKGSKGKKSSKVSKIASKGAKKGMVRVLKKGKAELTEDECNEDDHLDTSLDISSIENLDAVESKASTSFNVLYLVAGALGAFMI